MKVIDILDYLDCEYFLINNNDFNTNVTLYVKRDKLPEGVIYSNLVKIEPIMPVQKKYFGKADSENDYVAALQLSVSNKEVDFEDIKVEEEVKKEANKGPSASDFLGGGMFNLPSPEEIKAIMDSDLFKGMFNMENLQDIMNSEGFQEFMKNRSPFNIDLSSFTQQENSDSNSDDDEDDEYEEI